MSEDTQNKLLGILSDKFLNDAKIAHLAEFLNYDHDVFLSENFSWEMYRLVGDLINYPNMLQLTNNKL
jgi:hypothetical protein